MNDFIANFLVKLVDKLKVSNVYVFIIVQAVLVAFDYMLIDGKIVLPDLGIGLNGIVIAILSIAIPLIKLPTTKALVEIKKNEKK